MRECVNKLNYLIVILSIFISGTPVASTHMTETMIVAAIIFTLIFIYKKSALRRDSMIIFCIMVILIILSMLFNTDNRLSKMLGYLCVIYIGFIVSHIINIEIFSFAYVNVMSTLALLSIVLYGIVHLNANFIFLLPQYTLTATGETYRTFFHLHYYNYNEDAGLAYANFSRNMGAFREPGMYQFMLLIAFLYLIFSDMDLKRTKIKAILLVIAIETTLSTTGIISMVFIIIAYFFSDKSKLNTTTYKLKYTLSAILFASIPFGIMFFDNIFGKLITKNNSVLHRNITTANDIDLWLSNPLFGVGPDRFFQSIGSNNGLTSTLALFGIGFIFVIFVMIIKYISSITGNIGLRNISGMILFIVIMMQLYSQALIFIPIFLIILFLSFQRDEYIKIFYFSTRRFKTNRKLSKHYITKSLDKSR